jgi:hypothetical protein
LPLCLLGHLPFSLFQNKRLSNIKLHAYNMQQQPFRLNTHFPRILQLAVP